MRREIEKGRIYLFKPVLQMGLKEGRK